MTETPAGSPRNDMQVLLAAIVASSDDAILSTTLEGVITSWNAGAERMYGYGAAQALGQPLALIVPDDRTEEALCILQRVARGERVAHHETVRLTRDGRRIDVLLGVSPVRDAEGRVVGLSKVARDISAEKAAQAQRRQAEERLQLVSDNVPALIAYVDRDLRYRFANRAYAQWFGRPHEELVGRRVEEVLGEAAWRVVQPRMARALAGEIVQFEAELTIRGAGHRCIEASYAPHHGVDGRIEGIAVMVHDVSARSRAAQALARSEERLALAVRAAGIGIFDLDHAAGTLHASAELRELLGWTPRQAVDAQALLERVHPLDRGLWEDGRRAAEDPHGDGLFTLEHRVLRPDGTLRWVSARAQTLFEGRGKARRAVRTTGVLVDVSERREAEQALRRSEALHRLLVSLHDATAEVRDPRAVQREVAQRLGRQLGASRCLYAEFEADGRHARVRHDYTDGVASIVGLHRVPDFGSALGETLAAGRTFVVEDAAHDPRLTPGGARAVYAALDIAAQVCVPLVKEGKLVASLSVHQRYPRQWQRDEIELVEQLAQRTWFALETARAQAALRESRDVLGLAMRAGRMGAWSRELGSGEVWWSRELEELFGLEPGRFGGHEEAFLDLVHPEDRDTVRRAVREGIESVGDYTVEFRFRHASERWGWMEGRGRALADADGRPAMLYGLGIDITERKQAEQELQRLNAELQHAARRKDEFLATLAHELRNPLAPMRNALEIQRLRLPGEDAQLRWSHELLQRQLRQLTRLVDDLLEISRITQGRLELRREPLELAEVVQAAVDAAQPLLQARRHAFTATLPEGPLRLVGDAARLTQVLLNLLNNAAQYTPEGGHVALTAQREGEEAVVRVRDDGIGLAPEHLPYIFEMFSQVQPALERSHGGLGIGLALVRALAALHGGSVSARSDGLGRGSEFELRLPLPPQPPAEPGPDAPAAARSPDARRVMVVDDNPDAAESLALLLELQGHEVRTAHDGPGAVTLAQGFGPEVAIVDIGLPGISGYEVARRIRAQEGGRRMLLVALTGWGQAQDKLAALEAGFDRHLTKPVAPEQLDELFSLKKPG
ncbi:hybrid sensor histidine kinase/response regulator [Azohydromonas australica]|uniref:hybrid sensor histidine kinase/response regulator n=1 Tax=Azohydromonas australica TaxID=364039 RepID=UPI00040626D8|nr:PAS domain S-box protein [Azohydromonas australica]